MRADAGLTEDQHYLSALAQELVSCTIIAFLMQRSIADKNSYWVRMMGRLREGIKLTQAQAWLASPFHEWVTATASTTKERADLSELTLGEGAAGRVDTSC
jgi:hypothetical protein